MKKVRGYVCSGLINESYTPVKLQNLAIRDYCAKNNLDFQLSHVEYSILNSIISLNGILDELSEIDGIVFYSMFQLPNISAERIRIAKKIISSKKNIYFALEEQIIFDKESLTKIEELLRIRQSMN